MKAILYGDNKRHTVVLIVPEWTELVHWAVAQKLPSITASSSPSDLMQQSAVISLLKSEIESASNVLKGFERPLRFDVLQEAFSQENQMLTPKLSVRRPNVIKTYGDKINAMYAGEGGYPLSVPKTSQSDRDEP